MRVSPQILAEQDTSYYIVAVSTLQALFEVVVLAPILGMLVGWVGYAWMWSASDSHSSVHLVVQTCVTMLP